MRCPQTLYFCVQLSPPSYKRSELQCRWKHIGPGRFPQAHTFYVPHSIAKRYGARESWGVGVISAMASDLRMREARAKLDNYYTLVQKAGSGDETLETVGVICKWTHAPEDFEAAAQELADFETDAVSVIATEAGYAVDARGNFDVDLLKGLMNKIKQSGGTLWADLVARACEIRMTANLPPFPVFACDNLFGNGRAARDMVLHCAGRGANSEASSKLVSYIRSRVAFPDSVVDRITLTPTDAQVQHVQDCTGVEEAAPIICEPHFVWIIEDCGDEKTKDWPLLRFATGVHIVPPVVLRQAEKQKQRYVNLGHQVVGHVGMLSGHSYVHEATRQPSIEKVVRGFFEDAVVPSCKDLDGDLGSVFTSDATIDRFKNGCVSS